MIELGIVVPEGGFGVVTGDNPWGYRNWSDTARGAARAHYDCMSFAELAALRPVMVPSGGLISKNAVMGMWGTWPKADQAMDLLRRKDSWGREIPGWGFDHVTGFPWVKTVADFSEIKRTVGFWSMGVSEMMLIGRRGDLKAQKIKPNVLGLLSGDERQFYDRIRGHSRKPYGVAEYFEDKFPGVPKLELFATEERDGWVCVGHRTGWHIHPGGICTVNEAKERGWLPADYDPFREPVRKSSKPVDPPESASAAPGAAPAPGRSHAPSGGLFDAPGVAESALAGPQPAARQLDAESLDLLDAAMADF